MITVREIDDVTVFDIEGKIQPSEIGNPSLTEILDSYLQKGRIKFLINLENVDSIDSYGVGEIMLCYISARNAGADLKAAHIHRFFKSGWPPDIISDFLYVTTEDALDDLRKRENSKG